MLTVDKSCVKLRIENTIINKSYFRALIENVTVDKPCARMRTENVIVDMSYVMMTIEHVTVDGSNV